MTYEVRLPGWPKGIDNIQPNYDKTRDTLLGCVNTDIHDGGKLRRRRGYTSAKPAVGASSLWSHPKLAVGYYAAGGAIYSLTESLVATAVVSGLNPANTVAFALVNGDVFWTDGAVSGRIVAGVNRGWGVETPSSAPTLAATTGALDKGTYQITTTFKNAQGEESAALNPQSMLLSATGGISLTNLPRSIDGWATQTCIYATSANGDVLYKVATLPITDTSYILATYGSPTTQLKTVNLERMPAGGILAFANGVLYVASGPYVFFSEPMRYGLHDARSGFYMYAEDVSVILAVQAGLYVCADRSYLISEPGTATPKQTELLPYGAVRGTGVYFPNLIDVGWFSPRGQVVVKNGQVSVADTYFAPDKVATGVSFIKESEGLKQIITVANDLGGNSLTYTGA
jgi:hypothetical protein